MKCTYDATKDDFVQLFLDYLQRTDYTRYNAIYFLDKDSYDEYDRFWTDRKSYTPPGLTNRVEEIKVSRIDTLADNSYRVHLAMTVSGKKTIELRKLESGFVEAHMHGMGIGGRYHFSMYPNEDEWKSHFERVPTANVYKSEHCSEHWSNKIDMIDAIDDARYTDYYVLKKQGKKRSLIAFASSADPIVTGWVDNCYLRRTDGFKGTYTESVRENIFTSIMVAALPYAVPLFGSMAGAGAGAAGGQQIVVIFF